MRMPNGYGSIIKLGGRRRKPYAVRISTDTIIVDGKARRQYRYLGYFEKRGDAVNYLSDWNKGLEVREHRSLRDTPTFKEVYKKWMAECENSRKGMSDASRMGRSAAFKRLKPLHDRKVASLRYSDVQPVISANKDMSESTVNNMLIVLRGVADFSIKYEYTDVDFSAHLRREFKEPVAIHKPYTEEELRALWKDRDKEAPMFALITSYTGMRPSELLTAHITEEDIQRGYLIGGMKTKAGKDRVIPLHPDIISLVRMWAGQNHRTLGWFRENVWNPYMKEKNMDHKPHDGRHTCATLMESAGIPANRRKLILGHAVTDITDGVYTHVSPEDLCEEIKKICISLV